MSVALIPKGQFYLKVSTSSDAAISLNPDFGGYAEETQLTKSYSRQRDLSERHVARFAKSDLIRYTMPLTNVNSSNMTLINSWWQANSDLHLQIDTGEELSQGFQVGDAYWGLLDKAYNPLLVSTTSHTTVNSQPVYIDINVKIINVERPINSFTQNNLYTGNLILMEV